MDWDQERSIAVSFFNAVGRRSVFWVFAAAAGFAWILSLIGAAPLGWFGLALAAIGLLWTLYAVFREMTLELPREDRMGDRREDRSEAARLGAHWQAFAALDLEYRNRRMAARRDDDADLIDFLNRTVDAWTSVRSDVDSGAMGAMGAPFDRPLTVTVLHSMQRRDLEGRLAAAVATLDQALKACS